MVGRCSPRCSSRLPRFPHHHHHVLVFVRTLPHHTPAFPGSFPFCLLVGLVILFVGLCVTTLPRVPLPHTTDHVPTHTHHTHPFYVYGLIFTLPLLRSFTFTHTDVTLFGYLRCSWLVIWLVLVVTFTFPVVGLVYGYLALRLPRTFHVYVVPPARWFLRFGALLYTHTHTHILPVWLHTRHTRFAHTTHTTRTRTRTLRTHIYLAHHAGSLRATFTARAFWFTPQFTTVPLPVYRLIYTLRFVPTTGSLPRFGFILVDFYPTFTFPFTTHSRFPGWFVGFPFTTFPVITTHTVHG